MKFEIWTKVSHKWKHTNERKLQKSILGNKNIGSQELGLFLKNVML
jgi:hypothetical protein